MIGKPVTLKFYNPLNREFDFTLYGYNNQHIYAWTRVTETKDGVATCKVADEEEVVNALYNSIPNHQAAYYTIETVYNDVCTPIEGGKYKIDETKCEPIFSEFAYRDTNASVTNITGNPQVLVQGLSTLEVEISNNNKMIAKNGARPSSYTATVDSIIETKEHSDNGSVIIPLGVISTAGINRLTVRASDSRWCSTYVSKDIEACPYKKPVVNVSVKRKNNFENDTTLTVSGTYSPVVLSGTAKNTLVSLIYRYWEVGKTEVTTGGFNFTIGNGEFSCEDTFLNLDNSKAYEFEVEVIDKFNQTTKVTATVDVGQAIFFVSSNKKTCYINGEEVATKNFVGDAISALYPAGSSMQNAIHPVGAVVCMATNTNPSTVYGGTWTLIDKGFSSLHANGDGFFTASEGATNKGTFIERGGHSLQVKQDLQLDFSVTDDGMSLGYFDWSAIGITKLPLSINEALSYSDGSNGGIVYTVVSDSGELKQVDVFDCTQTAGSASFHLSFTVVISKDYMKDSACDKFYWKRTA